MANNFKVKNKRPDLSFEIEFTRAYRKYKKICKTPTELELKMLRVQFPAILHEIEDEDIFAGRIEFGKVGLGIQTQTGGFGYYIDEAAVTDELENRPGSLAYREGLNEMLTFWKAENTTQRVLDAMPPYMKEAIISERWEVIPMPTHPIMRMAGTYLDFDKLIRIGLPGLDAEIRAAKQTAIGENRDIELYDAMLDALDLMRDVFVFYRDQALRLADATKNVERANELRTMAQVLEFNINRAPSSMREAIQLAWLFSLITPEVSFGRVDIYLGDLYVHDVDNGIITEQEALRYMQGFYRIMDNLDCEMDSRVIVGGYGRRNPENADRLALVAIEACRTVKLVVPQFTLRFNKETPKAVWEASLRCIEEGRSYPLLYNDEIYVPGMMEAAGVSREIAERYLPLGCGEMEFDHYSYHTPSAAYNAYKILEIAMYGGWDPIGRWHIGPRTKPLKDCANFEEFFEYYKQHLHFYIVMQAQFEKLQYDVTSEIHTFVYPSMLYDGCIEKGKPVFGGGTPLHGTLEVYGGTNAADSLTAIKKLVFEEKEITVEQLLEAMENNFDGYAKLRKQLLDAPKYGNDNQEADEMLVTLHNYISDTIREQAKHVGLHSYLSVTVNNAQNTTLGRWTGAMPDGRKAGLAMANANSPAHGAERNGVTAMLNSIRKPKHDHTAGMVQNVRFSKETFRQSPEKVHKLIHDYFDLGGAQLMVSVVGKEDLERAIEHPEEYEDLIVRVGGFSAKFVGLNKDVQREVYERATY